MTDKFTFDQAHKYFSYRLPLERLAKANQVCVKCPFHQDRTPSLSLNLDKAVWHCHSCNAKGGILDFERQMMNTTVEESWAAIYKICDIEPPKMQRKLVATYDYVDVDGRLLYQKLRYDPKDFSQRQPDGRGGWWYNLSGVKKVLYRLPELVVSPGVFIVEGEKDADNLRAALAAAGVKDFAVTTCFDGAGNWKDEYSPYFTGRAVVVLRDNDAKGLVHQQRICASVKPFAARVKAVDLPGMKEKEDISDWLAAGHTIAELIALVKSTPIWTPPVTDHVLLEEVHDFMDRAPVAIEYLVDGLIPARTRGLMVGGPKEGKSPLSLDLALALASGSSWLGHVVPERRRVAIISREDSPDETARRLRLLKAGSAARGDFQWGQIYINTMTQSAVMHLDNAEHLEALIHELKMEQFDLVIFDVLRELHTQDENDNTAIANTVLAATKRIQTECKCAVLVLHHLSKAQSTNVFRDARGAGAIHGWTEWGVGLTVCDETKPRREWIRKVEFEIKYTCPADPVFFKISGDDVALRIELTEAPVIPRAARREKVSEIKPAKSYYEREDA